MSSRKKASEEDDEEVEESNDDAEARNLVSEICKYMMIGEWIKRILKPGFSGG